MTENKAISIAITNNKGGVGKTFIATHIAYVLGAFHKKKVLLIDTDTQGHVMLYTNQNYKQKLSIRDLIMDDASLDEVIIKTEYCDIIPSSEFLSTLEAYLVGKIAREYTFKRALEDHGVYDNYDFIIFDTSPSISLINQNVIVASNYYAIPVNLEPLGYVGCVSTTEAISTLKRLLRIEIKPLGIIPSIVLMTSNIAKEMLRLYQEQYGDRCLRPVRHSVRVKEAVNEGKTLFEYDPNNKVCNDIIELTQQILSIVEAKNNG